MLTWTIFKKENDSGKNNSQNIYDRNFNLIFEQIHTRTCD